MQRHRRILLAGGIAVLVTLFFATGLHRHLSLENVKAQQSRLQETYHQQPIKAMAAFSAVYVPVVALNLPGALVLGLAAGAIFGALAGTILISFASSLGATLACLLSRYLLRDWVQRRFVEKLQGVNVGIRQEGPFYLFALRLMPVIPFFIINLVMGLTPMRLWTFYWVSQLGMLPGTAVFVNAGSQIGRIDTLAGILSPFLSWYGFPRGCDTVFFPGCTLPGTRPTVTLQMYRQLREMVPNLGLVWCPRCISPIFCFGRGPR